jgi:peptidyl-tRNA hydrolase, PTH1 family
MDQILIMGLGNPDPEFEETYHNVGMMAVEWLAARAAPGLGGMEFRPYKDLFSYAKAGNKVFIRQSVYMNESGRAAKEALRMFGAAASDLIVIHDDSDLPVGSYKRASGGGSAGHKGVQSIIDHLGTQEFVRIRIGIREKEEIKRKKAGDFVLSPITADDRRSFEVAFEGIATALSEPGT